MQNRQEDRPEAGKELARKIQDRSAHVGVIGLGYVGLSLSLELAKAGFRVIGIDVDRDRVKSVNAGISYVLDVPSETLLSLVAQDRLRATQSLAAIASLDTVSVCVPTPLRKTKDPNLSYLIAAIEAVRNHLRLGQLIVLESTTYPGTTEEIVLPILERSGLEVGKDFFLAFSPERVDPGNQVYTPHTVPRVTGGVTPRCTKLGALFYEQFFEKIIPVSSAGTAEMVKLLENTFRSVNIALANEMALICRKLNVNFWEVIEAAKTKPFGFMAFYPGPGMDGHPIPIDPYYLAWKARMTGFEPRLVELAAHINSQIPTFMVNRVADVLNEKRKSLKGSRILALGVTYKRDIDDIRESPALEVLHRLQEKGALVCYSDPYVPSIELDCHILRSVELTPEVLRAMDCVVVLTDHSTYDYATIATHSPLVVDSRNVFRDLFSPKVVQL